MTLRGHLLGCEDATKSPKIDLLPDDGQISMQQVVRARAWRVVATHESNQPSSVVVSLPKSANASVAVVRMGWEQQCAKRPGGGTSETRARIADRPAEVLVPDGMRTPPEDNMMQRARSDAALLEDERKKAEYEVEEWSIRKTVGVGILFVSALWLFCFGMTRLLVYALLRLEPE